MRIPHLFSAKAAKEPSTPRNSFEFFSWRTWLLGVLGAKAGRIIQHTTRSLEHFAHHGGREFPGEGVLLAGMISADEKGRVWKGILPTVTKNRSRTGGQPAASGIQPNAVIEGDFSKRDHAAKVRE